jgi:hypothetical protein
MELFFQREKKKHFSTLSSLIIGKQTSISAAETAGITVIRRKKKKKKERKRNGSKEQLISQL